MNDEKCGFDSLCLHAVAYVERVLRLQFKSNIYLVLHHFVRYLAIKKNPTVSTISMISGYQFIGARLNMPCSNIAAEVVGNNVIA